MTVECQMQKYWNGKFLKFSFQCDIEINYRKSSKFEYRKILGWNKMDICKFTENMETYTMLKEHLLNLNKDFGDLIHNCPYKNIILDKLNFLRERRGPNATSLFPNGDLKALLRCYNNRQKNILFFQTSWKQVNLKSYAGFK